MKPIEERREEIFRRSEQRLRIRRRRVRQTLLLCIPLVLCLLTVTLLFPRQADLPLTEDGGNGVNHILVRREYSDYERESTDPERIAELTTLLNNAFSEDFGEPENTLQVDQATTAKKSTYGQAQTAGTFGTYGATAYRITLTSSEGTRTYRFFGTQLTDETASRSVTLTRSEAAALNELLERLPQ